MRESEKEIARFDAIDDEGRRYTVVELQRVAFRRDINGTLHALEGLKRLALLSGENVNRLQDGTLKIFETGKIIRKIN
jgi:hypothetical protein